jgi:hypothetical protein
MRIATAVLAFLGFALEAPTMDYIRTLTLPSDEEWDVLSVAVDGNKIFAALGWDSYDGDLYVRRSLDLGLTSDRVAAPSGMFAAFSSNGISARNGVVFYIDDSGEGVYRSVNDGASWSVPTASNFTAWAAAYVETGLHDPQQFKYANGVWIKTASKKTSAFSTRAAAILRSTDNGASFNLIAVEEISGLMTNSTMFSVAYAGGNVWYGLGGWANTAAHLVKSSDNGVTWGTYLGDLPQWANQLAYHDGVLFVTRMGGTAQYWSSNEGTSWTSRSFGQTGTQYMLLGGPPAPVLNIGDPNSEYTSDLSASSWTALATSNGWRGDTDGGVYVTAEEHIDVYGDIELGPPVLTVAIPLAPTRAWLEWTPGANADGHEVHRGTADGFTPTGGTLVDTLGPTAAAYEDTGLTAETTYWYVIVATLDTETAPSNYKSVTTPREGQNPLSGQGWVPVPRVYNRRPLGPPLP